ncbi:hypothetical protein MMC25_004214 [Agyrium rufum]|nr:hypothetical protein [Agyrium rufum]
MAFSKLSTAVWVAISLCLFQSSVLGVPIRSDISALPHENEIQTRATGGVVSNGGVAVYSINDNDGVGAGSDSYTLYLGNGNTFPQKNRWASFNNMFAANTPHMLSSCSQWSQAQDSSAEVASIRSAIESVAQATRVDHRFILAIMMQESGGCVRVPTTNYGVRNPGLMQDHDGDGTCNSDITGRSSNPCPANEINEMISEGTAGTNAGDGLAATINQSGAGDVTAFYKGARIYNSGSIAASGNLQDGIATHCYASDIANRLTGWVNAPHGCHLDGN